MANNPWGTINRVTVCANCQTYQTASERLCGNCGQALVCATCQGDGYTETWNDDQSGVIITLCPDCRAT